MLPFSFVIMDDQFGLENNEIYPISFTGSTPTDGVILGMNSSIVIIDDDSESRSTKSYIIITYIYLYAYNIIYICMYRLYHSTSAISDL